VEKYGTAKQATDINITWRMRVACWINKATCTHSEYVVFIDFPRQPWLRERALMLLLNVHCLCCNIVFDVSLIIEPRRYFGTETTAVATMGSLSAVAS
jgi:hypothetical protein